jgi:Flp pilus assembly pilin Flp
MTKYGVKIWLARFADNEDGATAIEYAMIATLIAAALLAAWPNFYDGFMASWTNAGKTMTDALK